MVFELSYNSIVDAFHNVDSALAGNQKSITGEVGGSVCAMILGKFISKYVQGSSVYSTMVTLATVAVETANRNKLLDFKSFYSSVKTTMANEGFTRARFEGSAVNRGNGIYEIVSVPNVIGYRTKSGIWSTSY